jgi:hypothetical protein
MMISRRRWWIGRWVEVQPARRRGISVRLNQPTGRARTELPRQVPPQWRRATAEEIHTCASRRDLELGQLTVWCDTSSSKAAMANASPLFDRYRGLHPARPPDFTKVKNADELDDVTGERDVFSLPDDGVSRYIPGTPSRSSARSESVYLWVVAPADVYVAPEEGDTGRRLSRGRLAHTNLAGSSAKHAAHAGGELWFRDERSVWLTGASGRYPPRSNQELEDVANAYRLAGYLVCSAGWDDDLGGPARMFRGEDRWL